MSNRPQTRMLFVGDVMLSRKVGAVMDEKVDWSWPFRRMAEHGREADVFFGNLEGPVSTRGADAGSKYSFRADPRVVMGLRHAGFDVLSVANNHMGDWGVTGLTDTLQLLRDCGLRTVGAGMNLKEAHEPLILKRNGVTYAFLAYSRFKSTVRATPTDPGITSANLKIAMRDTYLAAKKADHVIVSLHFGVEYASEPRRVERLWGQFLVQMGASLVIGHHPHVCQPVLAYRGGYIAYSLGNFVFDQDWSEETMVGQALEVVFAGKEIASVRAVPVQITPEYQAVLDWDRAQPVETEDVDATGRE